MLWRVGPLCLVMTALWVSRARAEVSPEPEPAPPRPAMHKDAGYRDHPFKYDLIFGADTRVGEFGMSFEYAPGDPLSLGVGVGSNGYGPEWSANARLRPVWSRTPSGSFFQALTVEGSVSSATLNSGFEWYGCDDCPDTRIIPQTVYWGQGELGWEGMLRNGFTFRASSGFANAIGSRKWQCESAEAVHCDAPPRQFYVQTFALGVAF